MEADIIGMYCEKLWYNEDTTMCIQKSEKFSACDSETAARGRAYLGFRLTEAYLDLSLDTQGLEREQNMRRFRSGVVISLAEPAV